MSGRTEESHKAFFRITDIETEKRSDYLLQ
jgi:hypothetical protein